MSITLILCVAIGFISYRAFQNQDTMFNLLHYPYQELRRREYHRLITGIFVHGDYTHLFINLFVLFSFGQYIEGTFMAIFGELLGRLYFLLLFLLSGVFANYLTYLKHKDNHLYRAVGASGGVSGVLLAYVVLGPWNMIYLYFIIKIPAIIAAVLYLVYSSWAARNQSNSRVDHDAHFWGAVFGFAFTIALKPILLLAFFEMLTHPNFSG